MRLVISRTSTPLTSSASAIRDLPTTQLRAGAGVDLTFYWPEASRWEGVDFVICVE
jgi:hypothetical protein